MTRIVFDHIRHWLRLTTRGGWSYVLLMPWFVPMISYLLIGEHYLQYWYTFSGATAFILLLSTLAFVTHDWAADAIARRYPELRQTVLRAGLTTVAFIGLSASFLTVYTWLIIRYKPFSSRLTYDTVPAVFGFDLIAILLLVGIYETSYSLSRWQQHQVNKEKLKKENLKGKLQGLKSQVNPHFLFNSLNSLSSLIADEPQRAEQFVDQMARVYRYMLQSNRPAGDEPATDDGDELTTLDAELTFIDSYYHLLKTRHGAGLHLDVQVPEPCRQYRLPPLTLQLLVENAVKHNVILTSRPLYINILITADGHLQVCNNLQKKTPRHELNRVESTQVGLANIRAKYQLLAQTEPVIEPGPDYFKVTLPLLQKNLINA
ncbi:sensor histidine kinase [Spirosoma endophyticum]|uniref:Histidine kinase n=1 Tax=Spirosoma endophyticum TaxID=662367 RepID=A0A1I1N3P3_9BACT|nr:histidine kinase [Spirosoma endophyticum]SFC90098.1 Histidine kinase [Spirosoma endophyticum]